MHHGVRRHNNSNRSKDRLCGLLARILAGALWLTDVHCFLFLWNFCRGCSWLKIHATCPCCRESLLPLMADPALLRARVEDRAARQREAAAATAAAGQPAATATTTTTTSAATSQQRVDDERKTAVPPAAAAAAGGERKQDDDDVRIDIGAAK
jgi:hypothetical protein